MLYTAGKILLQESPMAVVLLSPCQCQSGPLLVEHITLAWTMALQCFYSKQYLNLNQNDKQYLASLSEPSFMQLYRLQNIIDVFQSGLGDNVLAEISFDENARTCWSFETQVTMAVVSVLCCMFTKSILPSGSQLQMSPNLIFQLLSRLPQNIHAVYSVVATSTGQDDPSPIIEQQRIGFALYEIASSINHSCSPNCTLRYHFTIDDSTNDSSNTNIATILKQQPLKVLNNAQIEIIPITSIAANEEMTISYGPTSGKHPYIARKECLESQYLFTCRCAACQLDMTTYSENLKALKLDSNSNTTAELDTQSASLHVSETIHLCKELERLRDLVERLNTDVSHCLNTVAMSRFENQKNATIQEPRRESNEFLILQGFENKYILPVKEDFMKLRARHFVGIDKTFANAYASIGIEKVDTKYKFMRGTPDHQLYVEFCGMFAMVLDIHARLLAKREQFAEAAQCVEEAVRLMIDSNMYDEGDVVIGREKVKWAQLLFSQGDFLACRRVLNEAIISLRPFVNSSDPDWMDATSMLQFLSKNLKHHGSKTKL